MSFALLIVIGIAGHLWSAVTGVAGQIAHHGASGRGTLVRVGYGRAEPGEGAGAREAVTTAHTAST